MNLKITWMLGQNEMTSPVTVSAATLAAAVAAIFAEGGAFVSEGKFVTWNSIATIELASL